MPHVLARLPSGVTLCMMHLSNLHCGRAGSGTHILGCMAIYNSSTQQDALPITDKVEDYSATSGSRDAVPVPASRHHPHGQPAADMPFTHHAAAVTIFNLFICKRTHTAHSAEHQSAEARRPYEAWHCQLPACGTCSTCLWSVARPQRHIHNVTIDCHSPEANHQASPSLREQLLPSQGHQALPWPHPQHTCTPLTCTSPTRPLLGNCHLPVVTACLHAWCLLAVTSSYGGCHSYASRLAPGAGSSLECVCHRLRHWCGDVEVDAPSHTWHHLTDVVDGLTHLWHTYGGQA